MTYPPSPAWLVLVVSADGASLAEVRRAMSAWPVPVELRSASNVMAAIRQALTQQFRLVIVDWAIDGPSGQALVRQLARLRPALPVLAFDALGVGGPAEQVLARPWTELTTALNRWLAHERERAAEARP